VASLFKNLSIQEKVTVQTQEIEQDTKSDGRTDGVILKDCYYVSDLR